MSGSLRLIDLHTDWILQYAPEMTVFDASLYPGVPGRLPQSEGYLLGTSVAFLACFRKAEDWERQADPWCALSAILARLEAEFPGRILADRADWDRFGDDPQGMSWGVLGIEGFDALIRSEADLARLPGLFRRGVRLFQPTYNASGLLAGSSQPGDDRGLTDLGRAFLASLAELGNHPDQPRPLVDLAHLNPQAASDVLDWFEADESRRSRLIPVYSHGAPRHDAFASPRAISLDNLRRLRALGGTVGISVSPPFFETLDQVKRGIETVAEIPLRGQAGYEGIAIGTDFLGVDQTIAGLENVPAVVSWVSSEFDARVASLLIEKNARTLIVEMLHA